MDEMTHKMLDGLHALLAAGYNEHGKCLMAIVVPLGDVPYVPLVGTDQLVFEPEGRTYDVWRDGGLAQPGLTFDEALGLLPEREATHA